MWGPRFKKKERKETVHLESNSGLLIGRNSICEYPVITTSGHRGHSSATDMLDTDAICVASVIRLY